MNCAVGASQSSMQRSPPVRRPVSGACPDIRPSNRLCATRISPVSVFPASTFLPTLNLIEPPWYGPVCPVVWEGWRREVSPYPDRQEKLFLTQNTLPIFDGLLDILDAIPGEISSRTVSPFFYAGLATRYESQRLTENDRDGLPDRINRIRPKRFNNWLSEREWIPIMLETADQPRKLLLKLDVDETNIDSLELASCEEIFAERERQYQESYRHIPSLDELCSLYGDPTNRKIYMMSRDVEGRWMDLHEGATAPSRPSIDLQHLAS